MNPDKCYIARVDKNKKSAAINELKKFCVNTNDDQFSEKLVSGDCALRFIIDDEEETSWFKERYEFSRSIPGKTLIGEIQLWIKTDKPFCDFEFWPVSSSVGKACHDSKKLIEHLTAFIKNLKGQRLMMDDGSGQIETIFEHLSDIGEPNNPLHRSNNIFKSAQ